MKPADSAQNGATSEAAATETVSSFFGQDVSPLGFRKGLVLLLLLGLIVRIGFFVEHAGSPSFGVPILDEKYYDRVARMMLAGDDLHGLRGFRPLLYPMFVAVGYKIGGAWGTELVLLAQHLLGVLTGLLVAVLGSHVFRHRVSGLAGGALFLLAPVPLYFEGELLIEPSYIFLICLGMWLVVRAAEMHGWKAGALWASAGALTVLTSQARANIIVFLAIYPLFAAWRAWRVRTRSALMPLLGLAGGLAMAIPWGFINLKQMDQFHLMPNAGGVAFYLGNRRGADGMFVGQNVITSLSGSLPGAQGSAGERIAQSDDRYQDLVDVWAREEYLAAMRAEGRQPDPDPMAISKYWTRRGLNEIRAAPAAWLGLMLKKCWLTLWNVEVPNNKDFAFLQEEFLWLRLLPVRWVLLLMLAPAGCWLAAKWGSRDALLLVGGYAIIYSAANVAFFICDRYRYPVWPAMAVIAGGGLSACAQFARRGNLRGLAGVAAGAGLMAALSLHNWFGVTLPNFAHDLQFRSIAWYEKGHFPEALADIDRSVQLDPLDAAAHSHRGNVLFALGRFEEARSAYEQALKFIPGDSGVWNNLGATLDALGRTNEALEAFRRGIECNAPSRNAFLGAAFIQIRLGRFDEATATLDQLDRLEGRPEATALAARSVLERRQGHDQSADALEQQARRLNPAAVDWVIERTQKPGGP